MTIPRQSRWLRAAISARNASLAATTVVATGLLLPAAVAATPHSHSRHALPTALHTSAVADTGTHAAGKRRKGKADAHPAASAAKPGAAPHHTGKHGKGRSHEAEPVDTPIPMYRARRGAAPTERRAHELARNSRDSKARGPRGRYVEDWASAPLVSRSTHGGGHHHLLAGSPHESERTYTSMARTSRAPLPNPRWTAAPSAHPAHAADNVAALKPAATSIRADAFAEGVSHPDDDERLPRIRTAPTEENSVPAPVVRVSAVPATPPAPPVTQAPVVQGFGSEITLPSAGATERPGGTRRRNHPPNFQPESLVAPALPLEEREAITEAAISPSVIPEVYDRNGRLMMPAPLKGSHDVLVHQNLMATSDGLERIYDDADLERLRAAHLLVSFPLSESLRMNEDLPYNRRVARPWTVAFAVDMAHAFYARFHQPMQINSAVRTVHFQAHLQLVNGNAAATAGEAASPHLTGQAIDFGKRGMSQAELAWVRGYLLPMMQAGKVDVEEEFQQACFHISVYRSYTAGRHITREFAQVQANASGNGPGVEAPETR